MPRRAMIALAILLAVATSADILVEPQPVFAQGERPFGLPFADPPGPSTWLIGQVYGNTTGAYASRRTQYFRGQGIHFGVDFSAPCGTVIVAVDDGVVSGADGPWGSEPHNLMIDHPNGFSSMYGHLLERPPLQRGTSVEKGQPVARVGDPDTTCTSRPHLHLEIRNRSYNRWYNPLLFIEADWNSLTLTGSFGRGFERDLDHPRRWQSLFDQPEAAAGGPFLNDYARPWPPAQGSQR